MSILSASKCSTFANKAFLLLCNFISKYFHIRYHCMKLWKYILGVVRINEHQFKILFQLRDTIFAICDQKPPLLEGKLWKDDYSSVFSIDARDIYCKLWIQLLCRQDVGVKQNCSCCCQWWSMHSNNFLLLYHLVVPISLYKNTDQWLICTEMCPPTCLSWRPNTHCDSIWK